MPSIDRLVRPHFAEARSTSLQEGFIFGLIPGVITNINDPEGIGRVQVECPLIEPNVNLPNDTDGWIPVLEPFVCNAVPGGSHTLLQPGSQVVMQCLFGDPRQMMVIGCLPSRIDRPHPELNRANGTHGSVTPGDVIEVNNDTDASQAIARPNGVVQAISGDGTITYQTAEHARLQLAQDGTSRIENDFSFTTHTPTGTVVQRSAEGAVSILDEDGTAELRSGSVSRLRLDGIQARLEGPLSELSQVMSGVRSHLSGFLADGQDLADQLGDIARAFIPGSDVEELLAESGNVLGQLQNGLATHFNQGLEQLNRLRDVSYVDLGRTLLPQAEIVLGMQIDLSEVGQILEQGLDGEAIVQQLEARLPNIRFPAADLLDGLQHDPDMQFQAILAAIAPDGFRSIQNLIGLDLHRSITPIQNLISETRNILFSETPIDLLTSPEPFDPDVLLERAAQELSTLLPQRLRQYLSQTDLIDLLKLPLDSSESPLQILLGQAVSGLTTRIHDGLTQGQELIEAIAPVTSFVQGMVANSQQATPPSFQETLTQSFTSLSDRLSPFLEQSLDGVNQLINALPDGEPGALLRVTPQVAQMETNLGAAGAIARVANMTAELVGGGGSSRIFANPSTAGFATPWGRFGFGRGGGSLFSRGRVALRVAQSAGSRSAGLVLNPEEGASLSSFDDAGLWDDDYSWRNEAARVRVNGRNAYIESMGSTGGARHRITVSPEGIFLNDINIEYFLRLPDRLSLIEARLAALEVPPPISPT